MKIISLFDGISCAKLALQRANITIDTYYSSEIDKYANIVSNHHHPDIIRLGDVTKVWYSKGFINSEKGIFNSGKIDLLLAGNPCQSFSVSGKRKGFTDPRGRLFFDLIWLLNEINPTYFLIENVKMSNENQKIFSDLIGVKPVLINSNLLSAQNRSRYYWTNIPFTIPEDKHIYLESIIESGGVDVEKSYCIDASYAKGTTGIVEYWRKSRRQVVFTERRTEEAKQIRKEYRAKFNKDFCPRRGKQLVPREDNKSNCITSSVSKEFTIFDGEGFRLLTPLECERLQTLPDNYTLVDKISKSQRYKMIGNAWTVDIIANILKGLK